MGNILKIAREFITRPDRRFIYLSKWGFLNSMPDDEYLRRRFKIRVGYDLNLEDPKTFNEKIQWLKLHDRNPEYPKMVDKYEAKKYVAEKIGEQYIIPTLGVWERFDDIDFDTLPNQFVLKCTHDSGSVVVVKDKRTMDRQAAKAKIEKCLRQNYYWKCREWAYKDIHPRIIAEQYINDGTNVVPEDYKIYCFSGKPKYIVIFHNRFNVNEKPSETVYDTEWRPQPFSLDKHFAISNIVDPRPECLDELLRICSMLCENCIQRRIDFYIVNNRIYFGEITLYTAAGFAPMIPEEMDRIMGDEIELPVL